MTEEEFEYCEQAERQKHDEKVKELNEKFNVKLEKVDERTAYENLLIKYADLEKENAILEKALNLYVNWADECGVAWDNFPDMTEKWSKVVEEKGLGWIDGLIFMVTEEAKEQLKKELDK